MTEFEEMRVYMDALEAELQADLRLWEPLIEQLDAEHYMVGLLKLRVASIKATLGQSGALGGLEADKDALEAAVRRLLAAFEAEEDEHGFPFNFELRAAHRDLLALFSHSTGEVSE